MFPCHRWIRRIRQASIQPYNGEPVTNDELLWLRTFPAYFCHTSFSAERESTSASQLLSEYSTATHCCSRMRLWGERP